nr:hypothetical protein [Allosphingosinicella vermicomposti]
MALWLHFSSAVGSSGAPAAVKEETRPTFRTNAAQTVSGLLVVLSAAQLYSPHLHTTP